VTSPTQPIRFASFLGDNAFEFYRQVVAHIGQVSGLPTEILTDVSAGMDALFNEARLEAAFGCGLPYVWKAAATHPTVRLMAAPVLPAARYNDQPIYFSDIIVRSQSPYQQFEDLRGAVFAYNQTVSFSGYVLPLHYLLETKRTGGFFSQTIASGSHATSMDWVEAGQADAAAIDSVVWEMELKQRPQRAANLRVIESLGPAGMPPVTSATRLAEAEHQRLTEALVTMHQHPAGQAILAAGGVRRFAPVTDRNYDDIRRMLRAIDQAGLTELR
jgi:phosphonate transport system substrate-binding protein